MTSSHRPRWSGVAFTFGVIVFLLSPFRHLAEVPEAALWLLIPVAFALWIVGLTAFRARYQPNCRGSGRRGLGLALAGLVLLTVGHLGLLLHLTGPQAVRSITGATFLPVLLGTVLLSVGALLFGLDALRDDVLPRLRALPLVTGLLGLAWIAFASDGRPDEGNPEAFTTMRTLFGLGWLAIALVFTTDSGVRPCPDRFQDPADGRRAATVEPDAIVMELPGGHHP